MTISLISLISLEGVSSLCSAVNELIVFSISSSRLNLPFLRFNKLSYEKGLFPSLSTSRMHKPNENKSICFRLFICSKYAIFLGTCSFLSGDYFSYPTKKDALMLSLESLTFSLYKLKMYSGLLISLADSLLPWSF